MTNNWADMANSTLFIAMGSNFVENHPAATAHVMIAHDTRPAAEMIVIDPRKSRTAILAEKKGGRFIRFRPGTDIAFTMAVAKEIIRIFEDADGIPAEVQANYYDYLNQTESQAFRRNDGSVTAPPGVQGSVYTDARFIVNGAGTDYVRDMGTGDTDFEYLPEKAASIDADPNTAYNKLKEHLAPYTLDVAAEICGCTEGEIAFVARKFVEHSRMMSSYLTGNPVVKGIQDSTDTDNYRATQMMYAMGLTQHTHGSQNVKSFAVLQTLTGNVGRSGAAINALRGIHNVQGSTDMGVLQHLIPGYSGNPGQGVSFGAYTDRLWGQATRFADFAQPDGVNTLAYDDAYRIKGGLALQSDGFYNMTLKWFGDWAVVNGMPYTNRTEKDAKRAVVDAIYSLWPKNNGDDHITMFRKAEEGEITAMVAWGQNPAVTEPNQSRIRAGFYNLDVLVVTDMFETETAAVDRKPGGVTYLFPACSHVEKAGSTANSGRVLQWRERACPPKGNSRSDYELLLRFAYAVELAGGFSHIKAVWEAAPLSWTLTGTTPVYDKLYRDQYGWKPEDGDFEALSTITEMWYANKNAPEQATVFGSEVVAENIYKQCCPIPANGGTMWLYLDAFSTTRTTRLHTGQANWLVDNRAKSRTNADPNGTYAYPGWGYSWLVNRRVLYNNGDVFGDVGDGYQTSDRVARFFVPITGTATMSYANNNWRLVHGLSDMPDNASTSPVHSVGLPGRFPAHTEPYETPLENRPGGPALLADFGRNTRGVAKWDLVHSGSTGSNGNYTPTIVATNDADYPAAYKVDPATFPLVLTTIRCVEHFQGGPITRNNSWNVDAEPYPWVEINSVDAGKLGIRTGDPVNVITARGDSTQATQGALSPNSGNFTEGRGFVARVGVGTQNNQRVGPGVVAIPWHWGDKGLSTGCRANDLCIDSFDANTRIPEYKACLCRIEKM